MNHEKEQKAHQSEQKCSYQAQYDNKVYTCKVKKKRHFFVLYLCRFVFAVTRFFSQTILFVIKLANFNPQEIL